MAGSVVPGMRATLTSRPCHDIRVSHFILPSFESRNVPGAANFLLEAPLRSPQNLYPIPILLHPFVTVLHHPGQFFKGISTDTCHSLFSGPIQPSLFGLQRSHQSLRRSKLGLVPAFRPTHPPADIQPLTAAIQFEVPLQSYLRGVSTRSLPWSDTLPDLTSLPFPRVNQPLLISAVTACCGCCTEHNLRARSVSSSPYAFCRETVAAQRVDDVG